MKWHLTVAVIVALCLGLFCSYPSMNNQAQAQAKASALRVGGKVRPPKKIKDVKPVYPAAAKSAKIAGVVIIEATIGADGKVIDTKVLRSVPMLDQAALDAVRQWEFAPTLLNGVAQTMIMTVTVNFTLQ